MFLAVATRGAEPAVDPKDLPRVPPTAPDQVLATFKVKPGFRIEPVAAEPLVVDPVALSFDENGRLFVVEMRDYSERRAEHLGRIRLLEDTDGDGRFDKSTVYADNLGWPTAVICYGGGVFVGCTPDILYFKDTDGDGQADEREVVFTGFASGQERLNVQGLLNSFHWGLDNRIHGATSSAGGKVQRVASPFTRAWRQRTGAVQLSPEGERDAKTALDLNGRDFSFDPRTLEVRAESGGGQHGMSFDNHARKFICSNSDHIQCVLYEDRYAARNPYYAMPSPRVSIAVDGPAAEVYRLSPDEPWRVIRTRWRVAGQVPGPIEGGGRASGYFTGATGITIYRGHAFPEDFVGDAFIADCGSNLVHRKKLRPDGVGLKAVRPDDEQKVEFLASRDNWFRPVQMANAPDGALYIADMYREVIEHPWSLPESIKKHLDLNSGNDRGRIYRVVPDNFKQPKLPRFGQASTTELVDTLEHPNGWHRDTAARLLYERQDKTAGRLLSERVKSAPTALGRLHALCALDGLQGVSETDLSAALADASGVVRARAVRLAEEFLTRHRASEPLLEQLLMLAVDPDPLTRYQLALTSSAMPRASRVKNAAAMMGNVEMDAWTRRAVLNSLDEGAAEVFVQLTADDVKFRADREALESLAELIGARNRAPEVALVLDRLFTLRVPSRVLALASRLAEGLDRAGSSLWRIEGTNQSEVFGLAKSWATDYSARWIKNPWDPQREAIRLLGFGRYEEAAPTLLGLLEAQSDSRALTSLARFKTPQVAADLLSRWNTFGPSLRREILELLLKRAERVTALLQAIEQGVVHPAELSATQLNFLRTHRDETVRQRAIAALGKVSTTSRQEVIEAFRPALDLPGHAQRGKVLYQERCASCHRLGREGYALGPDLVTVKQAGKEKLLVNILDPNREVAPNYLAYLLETKDGESLVGLIAHESATSLTVRQAFGQESVLLRSNLQRLESQKLSLMPEGLEAGLLPQGMADLLEFIVTGE